MSLPWLKSKLECLGYSVVLIMLKFVIVIPESVRGRLRECLLMRM